MEQGPHTCPTCEERAKAQIEQDEFALAILLALVPLVVMTFFSQVGLL